MTVAAAAFEGFKPAPRAAFEGRAPASMPPAAVAAGCLSRFCASRASCACFRSVVRACDVRDHGDDRCVPFKNRGEV